MFEEPQNLQRQCSGRCVENHRGEGLQQQHCQLVNSISEAFYQLVNYQQHCQLDNQLHISSNLCQLHEHYVSTSQLTDAL